MSTPAPDNGCGGCRCFSTDSIYARTQAPGSTGMPGRRSVTPGVRPYARCHRNGGSYSRRRSSASDHVIFPWPGHRLTMKSTRISQYRRRGSILSNLHFSVISPYSTYGISSSTIDRFDRTRVECTHGISTIQPRQAGGGRILLTGERSPSFHQAVQWSGCGAPVVGRTT